MKAVLMSIRPNWCKLICAGMKTLEVRKTRPKLETPFRVYIYCTNHYSWIMNFSKTGRKKMNGKIIGEFTCEKIERVYIPYPAYQNELDVRLTQNSCLSYSQLHRYALHDDLFFWHISNVKSYDEPKSLLDFHRSVDKTELWCKKCAIGGKKGTVCAFCYGLDGLRIRRPPQSWCYVEDGE